MSAAAGRRARFKQPSTAENAREKRESVAAAARKGARAAKTAEHRRSNPVQNFINGGKTKPEKESRSKIAYILATVLKTGDEVPLHILEGAEAIRLANPTAYSATTGSELENLGIRIGVKTKSGHQGTYPDPSRKEWVRYDSARGNNTPANMANEVDVVDFKEGVYSKDRDTGINLFNLIYEEYIPQWVMPWHITNDTLSYTGQNGRTVSKKLTRRNHRTYFIKARFDLNLIKAWVEEPLNLATYKVKEGKIKVNVIKKPYTTSQNTVNRFKFQGASNTEKQYFKELIRYSEGLFKTNSKGLYDWEPDACYWDGNLRFIELKATEGKGETFPAEAVQLAKGKKLASIVLNWGEKRVNNIKTYFVPWFFATNYNAVYRNWKTAAAVTNTTRKAGLDRIAVIARALSPLGYNANFITTKNNRVRAFPNVNLGAMNAALTTLRTKRSTMARETFAWTNTKSIIKLWNNEVLKNGFKKILGNWTPGGVASFNKLRTKDSIERNLINYTSGIIRKWLAGKSVDYVARIMNKPPAEVVAMVQQRFQSRPMENNGIFHFHNSSLTYNSPQNSENTARATPTASFTKELIEVVRVWEDFANWRNSTRANNNRRIPPGRAILDIAKSLATGLSRNISQGRQVGSRLNLRTGVATAPTSIEGMTQAAALNAQLRALQQGRNTAGNAAAGNMAMFNEGSGNSQ